MKKILITGSEGFIGKKLIGLLNKKKKFKIFGVDKCNKTQDYKLYKYDLDKFININKQKRLNFDYIIHLAANSNPYEKNQKDLINDNLLTSIDLFLKFKNKKTKFLFASSEWVYQQSEKMNKLIQYKESCKIDVSLLNPYSLTKYLFELYALKHKKLYKNVIIMRFGIILGKKINNKSAVEMILSNLKNKEVIKIGSLRNARNYISLTDLVNNIYKLIFYNKTEIFNLTGSKSLNFKSIIKDFEKKFQLKSKIKETKKSNISIRIAKNNKIKKAIKFSEVSYYQDLIN